MSRLDFLKDSVFLQLSSSLKTLEGSQLIFGYKHSHFYEVLRNYYWSNKREVHWCEVEVSSRV